VPALTEDADEPVAAAERSRRSWHWRPRFGRYGGVALAADGQQPPSRQGDGQPQPFGVGGIAHAGVLPLPAAALDFLEAVFDPGAEPVPTDVGRLRLS